MRGVVDGRGRGGLAEHRCRREDGAALDDPRIAWDQWSVQCAREALGGQGT